MGHCCGGECAAPLVSVIMPAYNAAAYIEAAIRSVINQTVADWELIVIDDGSRDATCQIVRALAETDGRIRLFVNGENKGTAYTRNRGLELCRGRYAALLDSDDIWHPDKLEKQLAFIRAEQADFVYCSYGIVDENGRKQCRDFIVPRQIGVARLLKNNVIGCSTVLLSRPVVEEFRFSSDFFHEDYVLWLTILQAGRKAAGMEEVLVDYRVHTDGRGANKAESAKWRWRIYRLWMGLPVIKSAYYLFHYALGGWIKYRKK